MSFNNEDINSDLYENYFDFFNKNIGNTNFMKDKLVNYIKEDLNINIIDSYFDDRSNEINLRTYFDIWKVVSNNSQLYCAAFVSYFDRNIESESDISNKIIMKFRSILKENGLNIY